MRMCKCAWALVAVALSGTALSAQPEWKPVGELQVASMKVMGPQIAELGRQANFTLLPMLVRQGLAATEPGIAFGMPLETADWGMKMFMRENVLAAVTVWPVAKPPAAGKPLPKDTVLTKDGKWACMCEDVSLAKEVAGKGVSFRKPLKKGLVSLTLDGRPLLDRMEDILREVVQNAESAEKKDGESAKEKAEQKSQMDVGIAAVGAFAKDMESFGVVSGVSKRGFDLRFRAVPRAGSALAGASRPLPADFLKLAKEEGVEIKSFVGSSSAVKDVAAWKELMSVLPECKEAKEPLFAFTMPLVGSLPTKTSASPATSVTLASAWVFAWRDGKDYRVIFRIPSAELAKAMMEIVRMQGEAT